MKSTGFMTFAIVQSFAVVRPAGDQHILQEAGASVIFENLRAPAVAAHRERAPWR
jgi:hypothetical protein